MSLFNWEIEAGSVDGSMFEPVELLVDTGSTYTWIPKELAARLGLSVTGKRRLRLADGSEISRDGVDAYVKINGERHFNFCLLAEANDAVLLGSVTLETFSLGVDPVNKKLVPVVSSAVCAN